MVHQGWDKKGEGLRRASLSFCNESNARRRDSAAAQATRGKASSYANSKKRGYYLKIYGLKCLLIFEF